MTGTRFVRSPEHRVECRLMRRPRVDGLPSTREDQTTYERRPYFVRVCLYSDVHAARGVKLHSHMDVELGPDFRRRVEAAAGALAEYQAEQYGDVHDPTRCAVAARECAQELLASA